MAADPWARLADEVASTVAELPRPGPDASAIRRKVAILGTRLESLDGLLARAPPKSITEKDLRKRQEMLSNLKCRTKQMAASFNMSTLANREDLLGEAKKAADGINREAGLDNQGIVGLQKQIIKEQDEGLDRLEETVLSTKHIALAVNEELDLHTRLIEDLNDDVDGTNSRLQRVQKRLAVLNKRAKGGCSCMSMLLSVVAIVMLVVIVWLLMKYM